jgi:ureidoglycolate lyase
MLTITARPLTAEDFAPYGEVLTVPSAAGRVYYEDALANTRTGAWASLSVARVEPLSSLPLEIRMMEQHAFSSQTFMPLAAVRWLIVVAPPAASGKAPDMEKAEAFLAGPAQGITYRAGVWHHPLTSLEPASFLIFMWRDGTEMDETFVEAPPMLVLCS